MGKSIENTQWAKWRGTGGHGFGAEDVNAQADRLHFAKVEVVGRSNEKDGADRIVNYGRKTTAIQTKYYQTAEASIDAAFDTQTGIYRYNGQVIEVPKDQYEDAIKKMAEKIRAGNVPGVSDPQKAESLLKSGSVTYAQAKNITKAGNFSAPLCAGGTFQLVQASLSKQNNITAKSQTIFKITSIKTL